MFINAKKFVGFSNKKFKIKKSVKIFKISSVKNFKNLSVKLSSNFNAWIKMNENENEWMDAIYRDENNEGI